MKNPIILTEEQEALKTAVINWYEKQQSCMDKQIFVITGYAGTGKTSSIKAIIEELGLSHVQFAAFTGKAARVINKSTGFPTSTIHSLIYTPVIPDEEKAKELQAEIDSGDLSIEDKNILRAELEDLLSPKFQLRPIEESDLDGCDLIVLDEHSMVNQELLDDLLSFSIPIVALGDPGQLPPIAGTGAIANMPSDFHLEQIHRQAADNPIIKIATAFRQGKPFPYCESENLTYQRVASLSDDLLQQAIEADQVICGMHKTRTALNVRMRGIKGFDIQDPYPQVGEKLLCCRNTKELGLVNGDIMQVVEVGNLHDNFIELLLAFEDPPSATAVPIKVRVARWRFDAYFNPEAKDVPFWVKKQGVEFDFGYVTTIHTSQGSQWDNLLVVDDGLMRGWRNKILERRQLMYTAVTRAATKLTLIAKY